MSPEFLICREPRPRPELVRFAGFLQVPGVKRVAPPPHTLEGLAHPLVPNPMAVIVPPGGNGIQPRESRKPSTSFPDPSVIKLNGVSRATKPNSAPPSREAVLAAWAAGRRRAWEIAPRQ